MEWFKQVQSKDESKQKELIPGGLAEGKADSEFDPEQIAMGVKIEMEHTNDKAVAKEIAKDHLAEFPDYYTHLEKMESEMKSTG